MTFKDLGLNDELVQACQKLGWKEPTPIQKKAIPIALGENDIIGLSETGSGKTGAFTLPILHHLLENPSRFFALILSPTRELAMQIKDQVASLSHRIVDINTCCIVGGMEFFPQSFALQRGPHIIVATPGRLAEHLEHSPNLSLKGIKYLVLDEADRLLGPDYEKEIDVIMKALPTERTTYLYSATITSKVEQMKRAELNNPQFVSVSRTNQAVGTLVQQFALSSPNNKYVTLVSLLNHWVGKTVMVFCATRLETRRLALVLRILGFMALPLHGDMDQSQRYASLGKFRSRKKCDILVATDVAARGLDIPHVDIVMNFDLPTDAETYTHRIGRTARAGRSGLAFSIITQFNFTQFLEIEKTLEVKTEKVNVDKEEINEFSQSVQQAIKMADEQIKESDEKLAMTKKNRKVAKKNKKRKTVH
eukprot:TRINITY_DN728_c0_g1_i1.p1 TRINITY_DN728_c0_g1~~TRINITY_DN728_c0_g1_i1.p1  ORF type:complete len:434 (-),score=112.86 TRINITY_DN728_c0_g1_i1:19-1281(-)